MKLRLILKKIFFFAGLVFVLVVIFEGAYFILKTKAGREFSDYQIREYSINQKRYRLLVADTQEKRIKGLMGVEDLGELDGMIFIFPDKGYQSFWNKDTLIDLKLIWLDDGQVVGEDFMPSIKKTKEPVFFVSPQPVNEVIELRVE